MRHCREREETTSDDASSCLGILGVETKLCESEGKNLQRKVCRSVASRRRTVKLDEVTQLKNLSYQEEKTSEEEREQAHVENVDANQVRLENLEYPDSKDTIEEVIFRYLFPISQIS